MSLKLAGLIAAVGISQLQYTDNNSPRNIFIVGVGLYLVRGPCLDLGNSFRSRFEYTDNNSPGNIFIVGVGLYLVRVLL